MKQAKKMIASWLRVFLSICIVLVMNKGSIWGIDWKEFANSAIISFLPVLYNFLNPADPRYGINKEQPESKFEKPAAPKDTSI